MLLYAVYTPLGQRRKARQVKFNKNLECEDILAEWTVPGLWLKRGTKVFACHGALIPGFIHFGQ